MPHFPATIRLAAAAFIGITTTAATTGAILPKSSFEGTLIIGLGIAWAVVTILTPKTN